MPNLHLPFFRPLQIVGLSCGGGGGGSNGGSVVGCVGCVGVPVVSVVWVDKAGCVVATGGEYTETSVVVVVVVRAI